MKDPKAEPIKIVVNGSEIIDIQVEMGRRPPTITIAIAHFLHREKEEKKKNSDSKKKANPSLPASQERLQIQHEKE